LPDTIPHPAKLRVAEMNIRHAGSEHWNPQQKIRMTLRTFAENSSPQEQKADLRFWIS
jgi:hypothetical protein